MPLSLDPPPIEDLAAAMYGRTLLDMRVVGTGELIRVMPVNLSIWPDRDELTVEQEYLHGGDFRKRVVTVDAEDIMWSRPTICGISDVEIPELPESEGEEDADELARHVLATFCHISGLSEKELKSGAEPRWRKLCVRLMWELTTLPQTQIPHHFGYQKLAQMTYVLNDTEATDMVKALKTAHELLEIRMGRKLVPPARHYLARNRKRVL